MGCYCQLMESNKERSYFSNLYLDWIKSQILLFLLLKWSFWIRPLSIFVKLGHFIFSLKEYSSLFIAETQNGLVWVVYKEEISFPVPFSLQPHSLKLDWPKTAWMSNHISFIFPKLQNNKYHRKNKIILQLNIYNFIHILYSFIFPSLKIHYSFGVWNLGENYKNMSIMGILAGNKLLFSVLYTLLGLWCWWSYAGIFNIFSYLQVKYLDRTICGDVFIVYRWICVIL